MSVIYIVLPLALIFVVVAVIVFVRAVKSGQFDDMDTPGVRILHDEAPGRPPAERSATTDPRRAVDANDKPP